MEGRNFTAKIKLGAEVEKLQKDEHVFPELVFIIHLISFGKPERFLVVFFAVSKHHR